MATIYTKVLEHTNCWTWVKYIKYQPWLQLQDGPPYPFELGLQAQLPIDLRPFIGRSHFWGPILYPVLRPRPAASQLRRNTAEGAKSPPVPEGCCLGRAQGVTVGPGTLRASWSQGDEPNLETYIFRGTCSFSGCSAYMDVLSSSTNILDQYTKRAKIKFCKF